jgi:RecJ-like exonuclease
MTLKIVCSDCGREWTPDDGIDIHGECPADDCPSHDDDSDVICSNCSGSGEGMYEGSRCSRCGGSGEVSTREPDDDDRADYYWQQKQDREYENHHTSNV